MLIEDTKSCVEDQKGLGRDEPYIEEEQVEDLASRYQI
jgi:hypothetical protein